jgi:hypothetical protein
VLVAAAISGTLEGGIATFRSARVIGKAMLRSSCLKNDRANGQCREAQCERQRSIPAAIASCTANSAWRVDACGAGAVARPSRCCRVVINNHDPALGLRRRALPAALYRRSNRRPRLHRARSVMT